jgi:hypothetical protein
MPTDPIAVVAYAAQCERDAEGSRAEAEAAWRAAWWRTTMALGVPTYRPDVTRALDEAERVLGQSRGYISDRRSTGVVFGDLSIEQVQALPPRLSMVWATQHAGQRAGSDVLAEVRQAETDGVSLREFAARYKQTFERPTTEQIVEAVRSSPEAARAIARDDVARESVEEAGIEARAERRPPVPEDIATPEGRADANERARQRIEGHLDDRTDEATNYLHGAASDLGHALFARDRWGINDTDEEATAIAAVRRLLTMYEAAMESGHMTDEDKQFLDSIGVHA